MKKWQDVYDTYMIFNENPYIDERSDMNSIYHYTDIHALSSILKSKQLWLTKAEYLNDRNEMKYSTDLIFDICYRELGDNSMELNKVVSYVTLPTYREQRVFIMSFSEDNDLLPLWAYYSQMDGYNLSFNSSELVQVTRQKLDSNYKQERKYHEVSANDNVKVNISKVIYDVDEQTSTIKNIAKKMRNAVKDYKNGQLSSYMINKLLIEYAGILRFYALSFKQSCFQPEKETRLTVVIDDDRLLKKYIRHRTTNGVIIPYFEINFTMEEFDSIINSIMIGPKNNLDIAEDGLKSFLIHEGYEKNVSVERSKIPLRF